MSVQQIPGLIVVLGSPNDDQGNLSLMGQGRVDLAYQRHTELQSLGWKFLLTGGFGEHFNRTKIPHAHYAKQRLVSIGVPETDFVEFALSRNTVDDALQSRPIVERYNCLSLLVVSSDFHIPRVEFVFRSVFADRSLAFAASPYIDSRSPEERERLAAHEQRELASLRERGESIVGGALNVNSWRNSREAGMKP
jgi:uncharacterized SAM-binding protein YcdF (DUF218 family)